MRFITAGAIAGAMILGAVTVGAQASVKFSGIKLVDMHAHTPEQTVNVLIDPSGLSIVDPVKNSPIKTFNYTGLDVVHTFSPAPPASAGSPSAAPTGSAAMPMYFGKDPAQLADPEVRRRDRRAPGEPARVRQVQGSARRTQRQDHRRQVTRKRGRKARPARHGPSEPRPGVDGDGTRSPLAARGTGAPSHDGGRQVEDPQPPAPPRRDHGEAVGICPAGFTRGARRRRVAEGGRRTRRRRDDRLRRRQRRRMDGRPAHRRIPADDPGRLCEPGSRSRAGAGIRPVGAHGVRVEPPRAGSVPRTRR